MGRGTYGLRPFETLPVSPSNKAALNIEPYTTHDDIKYYQRMNILFHIFTNEDKLLSGLPLDRKQSFFL